MKRLLTYEDTKPDWPASAKWEWFLHISKVNFKRKMEWAKQNWPV